MEVVKAYHMRILSILIYIFSIAIPTIGQVVHVKPNRIDKEYYKDSTIKSEKPYKNYLLNGDAKEYFKNGLLAKESFYKDGVPYGIWKEYYEGGELKKETPFNNPIQSGIHPKANDSLPLISKSQVLGYLLGHWKPLDNGSIIQFDTIGGDTDKVKYSARGNVMKFDISTKIIYRGDRYKSATGYYLNEVRDKKVMFSGDVGIGPNYTDYGVDCISKDFLDLNVYSHPVFYSKITGLIKEYYRSGQLMAETPYSDGWENGIAKSYYESGKIMNETPYTYGKIIGEVKSYYEWGLLKTLIPYTNGQIEGVQMDYYESKKLKSSTPFKNDLRNGIVKTYFESGILKDSIPYTDGKINGTRIGFYESGDFKDSAHFINGKEIGMEKAYYESGKIWIETKYDSNGKEGTRREYFENGKVKMEDKIWSSDRTQNVSSEFYESGKLRSQTTFTYGQLNGIRQETSRVINEYYENGKLKSESTYIVGKGSSYLVKKYDETGKEIITPQKSSGNKVF